MRKSSGLAIALSVGVVAALVPPLLAVWFSVQQGVADQEAHVLAYARDALRRSEETARQFHYAVDSLERAHFKPCSPAEINLMRDLDISSSYIQAVGRISGDTMVCDSLGTPHPVELGPPTTTNFDGVSARVSLNLRLAPSHSFTLISKGDFAILVEPSLPVDVDLDGHDVAVGVYAASTPRHEIMAQDGVPFDRTWFHEIQPGETSTFVVKGTAVALVRSRDRDFVAFAASPGLYLRKRMERFALIFVPIGLACSLATAWAIWIVFRARYTIQSELRTAIRRKELSLVYQPIVDLNTHAWVGAEALVRWQREGLPVSPSIFIPIAEQHGMIRAITERVFEIAGHEIHFCTALSPDFQFSINLSAEDLASAHTVEVVQNFISRPGVGVQNLRLEATERGFLQGEQTERVLAQLRKLGIPIAIDDFGTGYSSLSCLQSLPLDTLKIDKAFVDTIGTDGATSQVVLHIIDMAHSLGLKMVAEGIESPAQAEFLRARGVQFGQGYLFSKPIPIDAFCKALSARQHN